MATHTPTRTFTLTVYLNTPEGVESITVEDVTATTNSLDMYLCLRHAPDGSGLLTLAEFPTDSVRAVVWNENVSEMVH